MPDTIVTRPPLGRRLALELRPARPLTWIGPLAAAAAGLVASGAWTTGSVNLLGAALALLLADPILGAWRALWVQTDWRAPLRVAPSVTPAGSALVPYAAPGSPASRLAQWWKDRAAFFSGALWPELANALVGLVVTGLLALAVAVVLGSSALILTSLALALAPLESEMGPRGGAWPRALAELGTPWLLGFTALPAPTPQAVLMAFCLSVAYRGLLAFQSQAERRFLWCNLGQIGAALTLIATAHPLSAGLVGLSLLAQILWQAFVRATPDGIREYLPRIQWLFVLTLFTAALAF